MWSESSVSNYAGTHRLRELSEGLQLAGSGNRGLLVTSFRFGAHSSHSFHGNFSFVNNGLRPAAAYDELPKSKCGQLDRMTTLFLVVSSPAAHSHI
jgi:hypothetical protein